MHVRVHAVYMDMDMDIDMDMGECACEHAYASAVCGYRGGLVHGPRTGLD